MRILTITSLFPRGTAPTHGVFVLQRTLALARLGAEVRVVSPLPWVPPGPVPARYRRVRETPAEEEVGGLPVAHPRYLMIPKLGMGRQAGAYGRSVLPLLREAAADFSPDILDVHYLYPDVCGVAGAAQELGLPYAASARGSDVRVLGAMRGIGGRIRESLAAAAAVISVSHNLAGHMRRIGLHDGPIEVIPNGVDHDRFHPRPRGEARGALGLPTDRDFVVCVGHLSPEHGQETLVRALAEGRTPPHLHLHLIGGGQDREKLEALVAELGLGARVHLEGPVPHDRIPLWFSAANASALISERAGSPNAVLESLACGTPCLVSDLPEMREAMREPADGRFVERDPVAVANGLAAMLEEAPEAAPTTARSWDDVGREVLACFESALSGRKATAS